MPGRYYDWPGIIARLSGTPGIWERTFLDAPALLGRNVNQKRSPDLKRADGVLEAKVVNRYRIDGRWRGDVWLRWVPERDTGGDDETTQTEGAPRSA